MSTKFALQLLLTLHGEAANTTPLFSAPCISAQVQAAWPSYCPHYAYTGALASWPSPGLQYAIETLESLYMLEGSHSDYPR